MCKAWTDLLPASFLLLSDIAPVPGDVVTPWFNIILQVGSFGLLTYIVVAMVPRSMQEARAERECRDKEFAKALTDSEERCAERNLQIIKAIEAQTSSINITLRDGIGRLENIIHSMDSRGKKPGS